MKSLSVYLCGPMEGVPLEQAQAWRKEATEVLTAGGHVVLDPTRRKKFHDEPYSHQLSKRIVAMDLEDIRNSDVILVNLKDRGEGKAWGSIFEVTVASQSGRVVIAVVEEGFKHPFLDVFCTEIHHTLEDALKATLAYGE